MVLCCTIHHPVSRDDCHVLLPVLLVLLLRCTWCHCFGC
jgi:hypothetical protein